MMYLYDVVRFGLVLVVWRVSVRAETCGGWGWVMVYGYDICMVNEYFMVLVTVVVFFIKVYGFGLIVLGYG